MYFNVPYKTKQFFTVLIKLSLVVGAFYFIYSKLSKNEHLQFSTFLALLEENNVFSVKNIVFLMVVTGCNWCFEILKWKQLVKTIQPISFKNALEQSLGGLTASLITPNRIGDYGAKAIYFAKPHRKRIVFLNLLGNMAQMTITTLLGCIGLIVFINRYNISIDYYQIGRFSIILIVIMVFTIFGIKQKRFTIKGYSFYHIIKTAKGISIKTHASNLLLALIRYLIFSFQLYYLLILFGENLNYFEAMVLITSMYLLASIIPSIVIFDVVIKGSVAVFVFGYAQVNELTILAIITLMWLLNFAIPSVFGSYFVLNFKLPKTQAP